MSNFIYETFWCVTRKHKILGFFLNGSTIFQICSNWIIRLIFHSSRFSFHAFGHHWDKNIFPHVLFFDDFIMCYLSISPLKKKIIKFPPLNIYILGARSITISVAAAEKNSPKPQMILEWIDQWWLIWKL